MFGVPKGRAQAQCRDSEEGAWFSPLEILHLLRRRSQRVAQQEIEEKKQFNTGDAKEHY